LASTGMHRRLIAGFERRKDGVEDRTMTEDDET
jgi:hypothetical protein